MIFPGILFSSCGRCHAGIIRKAASIFTDVNVLYTKPTYCCKIHTRAFEGIAIPSTEKVGWSRLIFKVDKASRSK